MANETAAGTGSATSAEGAVDSKHPDWTDRWPEWETMRVTFRGTTAVKEAGKQYLDIPLGFTTQPDKGLAMYNGYKGRAQFPEILPPTIMGMHGVIHRMEAQIEMPDAKMPLWERATKDGLTLDGLHRKITYELLLMGRYGLLVDAATAEAGGSKVPWFAGYGAEAIINWSDDQDFYVLDETALERTGFSWQLEPMFRVLEIENGTYQQRVFVGDSYIESAPIVPTALGARALPEIPFVVIGTQNLTTLVDTPPLLGVARSALSIYQLSADYRHQLYMSGQETLFIVNMEPPDAIGAGAIGYVTDVGVELHKPEAKYVGPSGTGIEAHRSAIGDEFDNAARAGARLFEKQSAGQESGEAKRIRYAAETATLTSIAVTSAQGLEKGLKAMAVLMGQDPSKIVVKPNLSFIDTTMTPEDATKLVKVWQDGGISYETLYENLQRGEIASSERTFEDELKLIDEEDLKSTADPAAAGMLPGQQNANPNVDPNANPNVDPNADPNAPPASSGNNAGGA